MPYSSSPRKKPNILGSIFLIVILVVLLIPLFQLVTYPLINLYQPAQCTITSKDLRIISGSSSSKHHSGPYYHADLQYTLHLPNGQQVTSSSYDWFDRGIPFLKTLSEDRSIEEEILSRYTVGQSYTCWYNPAATNESVLTREINWPRLISGEPVFEIIALGAGFILLLLVGRMFLAILIGSRRA